MATSLSKNHLSSDKQSFLSGQRQVALDIRAKSRARDQRMFKFLILMTSVFFLPVAVLRKLGQIGGPISMENAPTIFADAKAMASSIIPFIFMG
jgi:hypothetical protein